MHGKENIICVLVELSISTTLIKLSISTALTELSICMTLAKLSISTAKADDITISVQYVNYTYIILFESGYVIIYNVSYATFSM